tara:strand:+ start:65 stop:343 length:279 start_codon:yes stop_codon:yes gene_type:complete
LEAVEQEKDLQVLLIIMVEMVDLELLEVILSLEVLQLMAEDLEVEDQLLLHLPLMPEAPVVMAVEVVVLMLPLEDLEELLVNPMHQDFLVLL